MTTRHICTALAIALLIPVQARAQAANTAPSFGDLPRILKVGDRVKVTDEKGTTREARVTDVTASSLTLQESATSCPDAVCARVPWTATEKTVTKIQRTDPSWNGTLIGFAPGAVGLAATLARNDPFTAGGFLLAALAGAGIGAVVDRLIGNEVIYRAPSGAKQTKLVVSPLLSRHRAGVSFSLGF